MRCFLTVGLTCGLMIGCQSSQPSVSVAPTAALMNVDAAQVAPVIAPMPGPMQADQLISTAVPVERPTTRPAAIIGSFTLLGDVGQKGSRDLFAGETVCDVLHSSSINASAPKLTVVLNRRCPEGTTSEMIDVGQNLTVLDPRRNYELRDGDELIVSVAPSMPDGLSRPIAADVAEGH